MKEILEKLLAEYSSTGDPSQIFQLFEDIQKDNLPAITSIGVSDPIDDTLTLGMPNHDADDLYSSFSNSTGSNRTVEVQPRVVHHPPPSPPSPTSDYEEKHLLGKGGMGLVWRVKDPTLNRFMALKVINDKYALDDQAREDFVEEAQISAQLQHPGIIPIYNFETLPDGKVCFTMKEIRGRTFKEVIQSVHEVSQEDQWKQTKDGWNLRRLITAFHSVCETMSYAHNKGVVHRDLKPSNIMIGDFGEVLVVDWGIAQILTDRNVDTNSDQKVETNRSKNGIAGERGTIVGSAVYMSPEQAYGDLDSITECSDVFSLGVILFQILSGTSPYKGTLHDILEYKRNLYTPSLQYQHFRPLEFYSPPNPHTVSISDELKTYSQLALPNELVAICERAMQYDPNSRYQTASDLAMDVQSWLDGVQRNEKALNILSQTLEIETTVDEYIEQSSTHWVEANQSIQIEDLDSEQGWYLWNQSKELLIQVENLTEEIHQLLQGALIYAPELVDIHRKLIEVEYKAYLDAVATSDRKSQSKIMRRIDIHLEILPPSEAKEWKNQHSKELDSINRFRQERDSFVGRWQDKRELQDLLREHRLVSIVGTAGVGKTHLALESAHKYAHACNHKVYFCDLSLAKDSLGILQNLAKAIHHPLRSQSHLNELSDKLTQMGPTLLILDNVEQIVVEIAAILQDLLGETKQLKILVTSRSKINIHFEKVLRLSPLSLLEGIELFVQRAKKNIPDFTLSPENRTVIGRIVHQLDCLPLAIELASARTTMLNVHEIEDRLSERFTLLRGKMRSQTVLALDTALNWSWNLLSEYSQNTFVQCRSFVGGFTIQQAESIIDLTLYPNAPSILDILEAMYDDNLLVKERQKDGSYRYGMLLSISDFILQKASASKWSPLLSDTRERHAAYFATQYVNLNESNASQILTFLSVELDNYVNAVQFGQPIDAFQCCKATLNYYKQNGPTARGIEIADRFIKQHPSDTIIHQSILLEKCICLRIAGEVDEAKRILEDIGKTSLVESPSHKDYIGDSISKEKLVLHVERLRQIGIIAEEQSNTNQAHQYYNSALTLFRELEDGINEADTMHRIGGLLHSQGKLSECLEMFQAALEIAKELNNKSLEGRIIGNMSSVYRNLGDFDKVLQGQQRALELATEIGDERHRTYLLGNLGLTYDIIGKNKESLEYLEQSLQGARKIQDKRHEGIVLGNIAIWHQKIGKHEEALSYYTKALAISESIGAKKFTGLYLGNMASLYSTNGLYEKAMKYHQESVDIFIETQDIPDQAIQIGNIGNIHLLQSRIPEAIATLTEAIEICDVCIPPAAGAFRGAIAVAYAKSQQFDLAFEALHIGEPQISSYADEYGVFLCNKGNVLIMDGQIEESNHCLQQAQAIFDSLEMSEMSKLGQRIRTLSEAIESELSS